MIVGRRDLLRAASMLTVSGGAYISLTSSSSRAQTSSPAEQLAIRIVNVGGNSGLVLEELLRRLGYLDALRVDATFTHVADSSKIIASLVGGDMDICMFSGFGQAFPAIEKGARLKILAGANSLAPLSLFSAKPDIKTLKDLEGRSIGTGALGAALHQVSVALLQKNGLDVDKIRFVNVGATSDLLKAVVAGTVDAGVVNVDAYDEKEKYNIHPIADFFVDLAEYPYQGSFASDAAISSKRDVIVRTLAAHAKLYRLIQTPESKDTYVAAYMAATNGSATAGLSQWNFIQKYKPFVVDLILSEARIRYVQEINIQTGVQKEILPLAAVADMSLAQEALKMV